VQVNQNVRSIWRTSIRKATIVFLVLISLFGATGAQGQSMSFEVDVNVPVIEEPDSPDREEFNLESGFSFTIGFFSKKYLESEANNRFGIMLSRQSVSTTTVSDDPYTTKHTAYAVQLASDWAIYRGSGSVVAAGLGVGPIFISHDNKYSGGDTAFSGVPNGSLLFSPYAKAIFPVSDYLSVISGVRWVIHTDDTKDRFPYDHGIIISLGIEVGGARGAEQNF